MGFYCCSISSVSDKKKLFPVAILVAILLVVLVGGVVYLNKTQNNLNQSSGETTQNNPTSIPKPTNNLTTYKNNDFGFSFSCPSQFLLSAKKELNNYTNFHNESVKHTRYNLTFTTGKTINGKADLSGFIVDITPTNGRTIDEEFSGQKGAGGLLIGTKHIVDTGNADEAADLTNIENGKRVYRKGNNFFEIVTLQNSNVLPDRSDEVNLDQVLATFQFS